MNRFARVALTASVLSAGTLLASCGTYDPSSFDPTAIFDMEIFNTKKKLPGERKPVFPEGTPGVPQGVPQELVKGYQEPGAEAKEAQAAAPKPPPAEAEAEAQAESRGQAERGIDPDCGHRPAVPAATTSPGAIAAAIPDSMA